MIKNIEVVTAPKAIGPYSQAIAAPGFLFISGQVPIDPATGKLVDGDIADQARQVLRNINAILEGAGVNWNNVVKTTIYLTDLAGFQSVNAVYAEFATEPYPARATIQVSALPLGALIEIEAVAMLPVST